MNSERGGVLQRGPRPIQLLVFVTLLVALAWLSSAPQPASAAVVADGVTFSSEQYVGGAAFPTSIAFTPDGRMFYNELCGGVRVVDPVVGLLATPFVSLTDVACYGDYGLLGLAIDPEYDTNGYVYIQYMRLVSTGPNVATPVILRYTDVNNVGTAQTTILGGLPATDPAQQNHHGGNNIHFGPDGKLYFSLGDLNKEETGASQNLSTPEGKMLRLNKEDGSAPLDNPFVGEAGADPRIYALGLRNSYDFAWHPETGALFATENGPSRCDELNVIGPGANYGWPLPYDPGAADPNDPQSCLVETGVEAIYWFRYFEWMQSWQHNSPASPTGIIGLDGDDYPVLGHSLLVCEFKSQVLRWLKLGGAGLTEVTVEPRTLTGSAEGCRLDIEVSPSGDIYYSTLSAIRRLIIDSDSDGVEDKVDGCSAWPNPSQDPPPWPVPADDPDCDGWTTVREEHVGSDPIKHCNANTGVDNEPDAWASDFNDDMITNLPDVVSFGPTFNKLEGQPGYNQRYDLNVTDQVLLSDVILMGPFFNKLCG